MTGKQHERAIRETKVLRREADRLVNIAVPYSEADAPELGLMAGTIRAARREAYEYALIHLIDGVKPQAIARSLAKSFPVPEP